MAEGEKKSFWVRQGVRRGKVWGLWGKEKWRDLMAAVRAADIKGWGKFPTWAEVLWQPPQGPSNPGCGLDQLASIRDAHFPWIFIVLPGWCHLLCELWDADTSWITLMLCINLASWRNQSITLIECSALVPGGCLESRKLDHIWSALSSNKEKN